MTSVQSDGPAMDPSSLPQELIDEVIDALFYSKNSSDEINSRLTEPAQKRKNLANCSLVCRAFLPRSQMHLFSTILLPCDEDGGKGYTKMRALLRLIDQRPSIADHIQTFELAIQRSPGRWIYDDPEMVGILDRITKESQFPLRRLAITGQHGYRSGNSYSLEDHPMNTFLNNYIFHNISSLHLSNLGNISKNIVTRCSNLKELVVIFPQLISNPPGDDEPPSSLVLPKIERLEYFGPHSEISKICNKSYLDLSNLRTLVIGYEHILKLDFEQNIIDGSNGSLETFGMVPYNPPGHPHFLHGNLLLYSTFLNFDHQPRLNSLNLAARFAKAKNNLPDICITLQAISTSNATPFYLTLTILVYDMPSVLQLANWETFGSEISRIVSDGRLFLLNLDIKYNYRKTYTHIRLQFEQECQENTRKVVGERLSDIKRDSRVGITYSSCILKAQSFGGFNK